MEKQKDAAGDGTKEYSHEELGIEPVDDFLQERGILQPLHCLFTFGHGHCGGEIIHN